MTRRILVQVKCEIDPTLNVRIDRLTSAPVVDAGDELMRVSPLGRIGVAAARRIPEAVVTAFAIGAGHRPALQQALAAGAEAAVELQLPAAVTGDDWLAVLAGWLAQQSPQLVMGDEWSGLAAARLGWAHLAGISNLAYRGAVLTAHRARGRGAMEKVVAHGPALVRLQLDSGMIPYVARARWTRAAAQPIQVVALEAPAAARPPTLEAGALQLVRPRTRLGATTAAPAAKASDRLNALMGLGGRAAPKPAAPKAPESKTAPQLAEELVRYLAHHQLLPTRPPAARS